MKSKVIKASEIIKRWIGMFVDKYPNDQDLGKAVRRYVRYLDKK